MGQNTLREYGRGFIVNKDKLIKEMESRLHLLQDRHERDYSGGIQTEIGHIRELKYG